MQKTHECNGPGLPDYPNRLDVRDVNVYMHDSGMIATHDYSCPVCRENHATLSLNTGLMQPCVECQEKGYILKKKDEFIYVREIWWPGVVLILLFVAGSAILHYFG